MPLKRQLKDTIEFTHYNNHLNIYDMKYRIIIIMCVCSVATSFLSCKKDDNSLAQKAIREFMLKNANDPRSYESLYLSVDSSNSNYYSSEVVNDAISLLNAKEEIERYEHKVHTNKGLAEMWSDVDSHYAQKEFSKYKQDYIDSNEDYKQKKIEYARELDDFKGLLNYIKMKKFPKTKFAYNKYRIKDEEGNLVIQETIFILSDDLKGVCETVDYHFLEKLKKEKVLEKLDSEEVIYQ